MRRFLVPVATLFGLALVAPATPQVKPLGFGQPPTSAVIQELPPLPGDEGSVGLHVNDRGQVVGDSYTEDADGNAITLHPVQWVNGVPRMLPLPPGSPAGEANSIDELGRIIGNFGSLDGALLGTWWIKGRMVPMRALPGARQSLLSEINEHLMAVGLSVGVNERARATLWIQSQVYDLGVLPGSTESQAFQINFNGHSAGISYSRDADDEIVGLRATLWKVRKVTELPGLPGAEQSIANGINDSGQVPGWSQPAGGERLPVVWVNGRPRVLPLPADAVRGSATGINNPGLVIGITRDASETPRGALWQRGAYIDLEALLPPNSGWSNLQPFIINTRGQITGAGLFNGVERGFVLTL